MCSEICHSNGIGNTWKPRSIVVRQGWQPLAVVTCVFTTWCLIFILAWNKCTDCLCEQGKKFLPNILIDFFFYCHCLQVRPNEKLAWLINNIKSFCIEIIQKAVVLRSIFCSNVWQKFFTLWKSIFKHLTKYKFLSKALHNGVIPLCEYSINTYWLTEFLTVWWSLWSSYWKKNESTSQLIF